MGILKNEYKSFLDDIEKNIKDKEDLSYIKDRFVTFMDAMMEQMDSIMDFKKEEMEQMQDRQKELEEKIAKVQKILDNIEKDIYAEDGFDFEILCPYCDNEFIVDINEEKSEIRCPECQNVIELDWTGNLDEEDSHCSGDCGCCSGCGDIEYNDEDEENEDDDM